MTLSDPVLSSFGCDSRESGGVRRADRGRATVEVRLLGIPIEGQLGPPPHHIDVLVLGAPDRDDIYDGAGRAQQRLGRKVSGTL